MSHVTCGRLTFLCGLPRSGKSTYSSIWVRRYDQDCPSRPRVVISGDDFRRAVHGHDYLPEAEGLVFASMDVAARALLASGHDVLVDETCTTQATLLRMLKLDINATPVFIETPASVCIERAIATDKEYLVGPIERMDAQLKALRADWDAIVAKLKNYIKLRQGNDVAV